MERAASEMGWRPKACGLALWAALVAYVLVRDLGPKALGESRGLFLTAKIVMHLFIAGWLYFDAARFSHINRDRYVGPAVVLPEIVVPYYLVKSRGWKGALRSSLHFAAQFALAIIVYLSLTTIARHVIAVSPA